MVDISIPYATAQKQDDASDHVDQRDLPMPDLPVVLTNYLSPKHKLIFLGLGIPAAV
jgi:hypothetical protein